MLLYKYKITHKNCNWINFELQSQNTSALEDIFRIMELDINLYNVDLMNVNEINMNEYDKQEKIIFGSDEWYKNI